jgi:hypothetical protein
VKRKVSPQGLVDFRSNRYSVPPGMPGALVSVRHRLGADVVHLATAAGSVVAVHRLAAAGAGQVVRDDGTSPDRRRAPTAFQRSGRTRVPQLVGRRGRRIWALSCGDAARRVSGACHYTAREA